MTANARWPDFFIVGQPKAGTSSLQVYLSQVPGICMSKIKEPNHFARIVVPDDSRIRPIRDVAAYHALFGHAKPGDLLGEASPTYLEDPDAARLIRAVSPRARIIVSLRDPVDLMYSFYLMLLRNDGAASFLEEIRRKLAITEGVNWKRIELRLEYGYYYEGLKRYLDLFGRDNVKVVLFEDMVRDTASVVQEVLDFLGIAHPAAALDLRSYNEYGAPRGPWARAILGNRRVLQLAERAFPAPFRNWVRRTFLLKKAAKPVMEPEAERLLVDLYRDDLSRTVDLLGIDPPWPRFAGLPAHTGAAVPAAPAVAGGSSGEAAAPRAR